MVLVQLRCAVILPAHSAHISCTAYPQETESCVSVDSRRETRDKNFFVKECEHLEREHCSV